MVWIMQLKQVAAHTAKVETCCEQQNTLHKVKLQIYYYSAYLWYFNSLALNLVNEPLFSFIQTNMSQSDNPQLLYLEFSTLPH